MTSDSLTGGRPSVVQVRGWDLAEGIAWTAHEGEMTTAEGDWDVAEDIAWGSYGAGSVILTAMMVTEMPDETSGATAAAEEGPRQSFVLHTSGVRAGTPILPYGDGLHIAIYGEKDNPRFTDYATEPKAQVGDNGIKRPLTSTLKDGSVSHISIRSAPTSAATWTEIVRLIEDGGYVTIAGAPSSLSGKRFCGVAEGFRVFKI